MAAGPAVFFQQSKATQDEFQLIEFVTTREKYIRKLDSAIREVKEGRKGKDDPLMIFKVIKGMNDVRQATVELLFAISKWQETFTKPIRPQIMECDYIIERIIKHIDFVNSSHVRKLFHFQILRGNALLLPFPKNDLSNIIKSGGKIDNIEQLVIAVSSQEIANELSKFMSPDENVVIKCYQILINCLPDEVYSKVLVPLDRWLIHSWDPQIKVISLPYNGIYPSAELQSLIDASLEEEQPDKKRSVNNNNKALQNVDDSSSYGSINLKTEKSSIHSLTPRSTADVVNLIKSNHSFNVRKSKSDNNPLAAVISSSVFDDIAASGDDNNSEVDRIFTSGKTNASPTMKDAKLRRSVTSSSSPLKNTSSHHTKGTLTRASMRKRPLRKSGSSVRGDLLAGRTLLGDNGISHQLIDDDDSDTAALSLDEVGNAELQELDQLCQQLQSVLRSVSPNKGSRTSSLDPRPNKAQQLLFLSLPRTNKIGNNENNNDNDIGGAHTMGTDAFSISSPTGTEDVSLTQSQTQVPPTMAGAINSNSNHIPISRTGSKATQLSRADTGQTFVSTAVAPVKEILQEEDRSSLASTHSGKESISIKSSLQPRADLSVASIHPPPPPAREAGSERDGDKTEEKNPTEPEKPKRVLLRISTAQLRAQWFQEEKLHEKNHSTLRY